MDFISWFPPLTTTALFGYALYLGRHLIITRLTKSVEHEFNQKLESVRSQMRDSEERLKAELRTKETEISALRSGALTALASRHVAIDKRRLEAVDQLWQSVIALGTARGIAALMSTVSFEKAAPLTERDPKAREVFEMMGTGFDFKNIDLTGASKARPFLSPMVWATFSALQAVVMHSVMQWHILKGGLGNKDFISNDAISNLIKAALPHYSDYIDKHGSSAYFYLLEALDTQLLKEIQQMLSGVEADINSVERAADILLKSKAVSMQVTQNNITI
jgi:hypothetical protein